LDETISRYSLFFLNINLITMRASLIFTLFFVIISFHGQAQQDAASKLKVQKDTTATVDLLGEMNNAGQEKVKLLPDKILFTQRIFWGEKGLMRSFNAFELTPEKRQKELKIRRTMLVAHQIMGMVTLGGMVAQGIVGAKLYTQQQNGTFDHNLKSTHEALASAVNITYFSTAALSLFAPPKMLNERKGYSSIKLHRGLAVIHLSAMIATNIMAGMLEGNPSLKPYHRAAAYTAFGAFAASMIVIKF
jgi:hypothetical protein